MRGLGDLMTIARKLLILSAKDKLLLAVAFAREPKIGLCRNIERAGDCSRKRLAERRARPLQQVARHLRFVQHRFWPRFGNPLDTGQFRDRPAHRRWRAWRERRPRVAKQ